MTAETFSIRPAIPADHDAVVACIEASFSKWVPIMGGMKPLALTADYHEHIANGATYVLESEQGAVAGLLIFWQEDDALYLDTIAVNPAYQKHGLGRRLLAFTEGKAREIGLDKITLVTNEKMVANQDYYKKNGFVETHRHALHEGRVGVWMRKTLAAS
ncbi:MAG: GNAT family N-acetyltransferase [Chloroflexi bacterium]|nr:GNAT family N-acetyltransferase [Chloroflexota bacterium]MCC6893285.1 GNAT family N-acetyltransferase [Anaerolineae bacterium]